jgi:transposase
MVSLYFGVDISKESLDIALFREGSLISTDKIENDPASIQSFFKPIAQQLKLTGEQAWICMEHTGIYNTHLVNCLLKLKFKICIESALQIKQSMGIQRGKSDVIDARRIALYAYKNKEFLKAWEPQRPNLQLLKALLGQRDRLLKVKSQISVPIKEFAGFLDNPLVKTLRESSRLTLKAVKQDLKKIDNMIDLVIGQDSKIATQFEHAISVTGIGKITALQIIIASGEFTKIRTAKQFACHAGVAPFEKTSGTSVRGRSRVSRMADLNLKRLLHMAALSAIQCKGDLSHYYHRKVIEGKNKMSVLNAVRNKLISRVYACVTGERKYAPSLV